MAVPAGLFVLLVVAVPVVDADAVEESPSASPSEEPDGVDTDGAVTTVWPGVRVVVTTTGGCDVHADVSSAAMASAMHRVTHWRWCGRRRMVCRSFALGPPAGL
jgi:hypothetical protein